MSKSKFELPPVSTLMGSTVFNYFRILKQGHVTREHYFKVFLTTLIVILTIPFHIWEWIFFKIKLSGLRLKKPPLFILGHWRSGTTLLHNMLCADPDAGYLTTYQSVFPNNMASKLIFKTFMKSSIPDSRPADNVKLNVDFPQEDEFAFSNVNHNAYYNFFYFPKSYDSFYKRSVHHLGLTKREKKVWFKDYDTILKKAVLNTKGKHLVMKNPVNTARIKHLLKLYPDAKFLYIYRNPVTVYLSTQQFFIKLYPSLILQEQDNDFINDMIFDVYKRLMNDYLEQKSMIPDENLMEVKYEDFVKEPVKYMKDIYDNLLNEDFEKAKVHFSEYFEKTKGHKKNKYVVSADTIEKIKTEFGNYMKLYGYDLPDEIEIKEKQKKQLSCINY